MTEELKQAAQQALMECPFCGSEPHDAHHIEYGRWAVTCRCGAKGASANTGPNATDAAKIKAYSDARTAWNTRALAQRPAAQADDHGEQLTKAKRLLVDLHKIGGEDVRIMIEARTGPWFVWGQDRASLPAPQQPTPEPDEEDQWRDVALRFDKHRMQALWHLQAMLQDPVKHADVVRQFLKDPTHPAAATPPQQAAGVPVIDIKAAAQKLMGWPLPKDFSPDCGISFDGRGPDARGYDKGWPTGTNLLTVQQAEQMLAYALEGINQSAPTMADAKQREREADRARFPDPVFNHWLDESVTENSEFSVWHMLDSVVDANRAWTAALSYAQPSTPDYTWPTIADYEREIGFKVNQSVKMGWAMAHTTNQMIRAMAGGPLEQGDLVKIDDGVATKLKGDNHEPN